MEMVNELSSNTDDHGFGYCRHHSMSTLETLPQPSDLIHLVLPLRVASIRSSTWANC